MGNAMNELIPIGIGFGLAFIALDAYLIIRYRLRKELEEYEIWKKLAAAEFKAFNAKSKDELRDVIQILLDLGNTTSKNQKNESYSMQIAYYCKGRLEGSP